VLDFYAFAPQVGITSTDLVDRARTFEASGFTGMTGMDHLMPGSADGRPMFEAVTANTWVAARTERLRVGSLVMCNSFRHPAVLAREVTTLDHLSGGRFDLGIGWGSVPSEFEALDIGPVEPRARIERLGETLDILRALWSGEEVDYEGRYFHLRGARLLPTPIDRIPIVIGGEGASTLRLVERHADWWNLHFDAVDRLDDLRARIGNARISMQLPIVFVAEPSGRAAALDAARPSPGGRIHTLVGDADELVARFAGFAALGIERLYLWFYDSPPAETIQAFAETVMATFRSAPLDQSLDVRASSSAGTVVTATS
jgi:alkanesulfonate monooxygenase SsuD/methylene tetrahydromethanopterin reductase-like flavin-dependent oxidoreductase (luciferase family)